ncbi:MAG TPA: acyl-ACP desaturase [Acidimicrobiia bacterium]|jgi:acyl-[acyl-carrier-protein] desaturase
MNQKSSYELLETIAPTVARLMEEHRTRREHWYAHEFVPWELGRNFRTDPWDESQCTLSPEARTSLVLNLLTEDNLPYYHAEIERAIGHNETFSAWNHLWTAEEAQHSIAIRSYLLTSRNCDPRALEDDRLATMETGFDSEITDPIGVFVYTTAQELATRVSHRNAGKLADDQVAYELMSKIATDENHHFMFYRGAVSAMLEQEPSLVLPHIYEVFASFKMPGVGMPEYFRRAIEMAKAGVYNLRIHHDRVVLPLLRDWKVETLTGLSTKAAEIQQKLMELPAAIVHRAESFERRYGLAPG